MGWGWQCESRGLKHKFIDNCNLIGISDEVCDENEEEDGDDVLQGKTITTTTTTAPFSRAGWICLGTTKQKGADVAREPFCRQQEVPVGGGQKCHCQGEQGLIF